MQMLGNQSGGNVDASNIHQTLGSLFGEDASPMLTQLASVAVPVRPPVPSAIPLARLHL